MATLTVGSGFPRVVPGPDGVDPSEGGDAARPDRLASATAAVGLLLLVFGSTFGSTVTLKWIVAPTLLGAALTCLALLLRVRSMGRAPWKEWAPVLFLWACFVPAASAAGHSQYANQKLVWLFGVTLLAALGAAAWGGSDQFRRYAVLVFAGFGVVVAVAGLLDPDPVAGSGLEGINSIGFARAVGVAGVAAIGVSLHALDSGRWVLACAGLVAAMAMAVPLVGNDNRGSLVGMAAASLAGLLLVRRNAVRFAGLVGILLAGLYYYSHLPSQSSFRFLLDGELDSSASVRLEMLAWSGRFITTQPFGLGWGVTSEMLPQNLNFRYVHNAILEASLEGGWIAGSALVAILATAAILAWKSRRHATAPYVLIVNMTAVFLGASAMVSGDLPSNRGFFVFIFIGIAAARDALLRIESNPGLRAVREPGWPRRPRPDGETW